LDFCFINTDRDDTIITILGLRERPRGAFGGAVLPNKSASEFAVNVVTGYIDFWGHTVVLLKGDQEPALMKIMEMVKAKRNRETLLEYSPKGTHASNVDIENAHFHLQGQVRAMSAALRARASTALDAKSMLVPWMVRHGAWLLIRFAVGPDGATAYERMRGKPYRGDMAEFGESINYKLVARAQAKLDTRWWTCQMR
jgi:hypothetical protein